MRIVIFSLLLLPLLTACSMKKEARVITPVMNSIDREMSCDNRPALVKECLDVEMCGKFGEDMINYNFCRDECEMKIKKQCRKPKAAAPARVAAPFPLMQSPTSAPAAPAR